MNLRNDIQKRIERKQAESREYELKIRENNAYIQGLQETIRLLPKEGSQTSTAAPPPASTELRPGSALAKTREAIRQAGKPLYITDILKALGRPVDRKNRASISGTISAYASKNKIFNRPAPNTFGLIDMDGTEDGKVDEVDGGDDEDNQLHLNGTIQKEH